jgi:hypothetical protein
MFILRVRQPWRIPQEAWRDLHGGFGECVCHCANPAVRLRAGIAESPKCPANLFKRFIAP